MSTDEWPTADQYAAMVADLLQGSYTAHYDRCVGGCSCEQDAER